MKYNFAAHFLFEKRRFWTKIRDFAAHFLFEKRRFWTKIRDFAAHFLFEKRRFWTKIRDFTAVIGYAPRAARGAQWRVLSGSKTRHIIHLAKFGSDTVDNEHLTRTI